MVEGPIKESSYYFPGKEIQEYMRHLQSTDAFENQYPPDLDKRIVVMTHDDNFDAEMYRIEKSLGFQSTWFLFATQLGKGLPDDADVHIHFNKETGTLREQIETFKKFGFSPRFNRNHRLLWRTHNFDFPLLAMNGILVDTTLIGTRPFHPVINGKIIPIWELPFCITDKAERFMASYCMAKDYEIPFKYGLSPIVVLSHPFEICNSYGLLSCFHDVVRLTQKYDYSMMSLSSFYDQFLSNISMEISHEHVK